MANSLMSFLGNMTGGRGGNILMQAVGAMMRGDSPQDFLRSLAQTRPELRGINLNDLDGEAQRICREHGKNADEIADKIKQIVSTMTQ